MALLFLPFQEFFSIHLHCLACDLYSVVYKDHFCQRQLLLNLLSLLTRFEGLWWERWMWLFQRISSFARDFPILYWHLWNFVSTSDLSDCMGFQLSFPLPDLFDCNSFQWLLEESPSQNYWLHDRISHDHHKFRTREEMGIRSHLEQEYTDLD